jgi:hypothetical protein
VAPGPYTIDVKGTSSALVHHVSVTITVTMTGTVSDFSVSAITPVSFTSGTTGTSTVSVMQIGGFHSYVSLSSSVSPSTGLSIVFSPVTLYPGTSTATFSSSIPGTYTVTITGKSGSLSHSATVTVTVTTAPQPTAPATTMILGLDPTLFYGLIGGIIAIAVVGGAVVFMRGKKPQAK